MEGEAPPTEEAPAAETLLSEKVVNDCKEYFSMFDHDNNDEISTRDLGNAMRAMGQHPKEAEIQAFIADIDYEGTGVLSFTKFLRVMARRFKDTEDDDSIREALKILDKTGSGTMKAEDMRLLLTTLGETLNKEEIEECITDADKDGDGMINIEAFLSFSEFAQILME